MVKKIFISSKIGDYQQQKLNLILFKKCQDLGFDTYLPQIEVPLGTSITPLEILEANERAVDSSDLMLMVFDKAGSGGAMEYQRIYIAKKPIIGYRSKSSIKSRDLGMMLEGAWQRILDASKSSSVKGIRRILERYAV